MNTLIGIINSSGDWVVGWGGEMLVQSSLLIGVLVVLDLFPRRRVRAAVRYGLWMLVLVKLVMPPSFAVPTGIAYWVRGEVRRPAPRPEPVEVTMTVHYSNTLTNSVKPSVPPTAPIHSVSARISRNGFLFIFWLAISAGMFAWMCGRVVVVNRRISNAVPAPAQVVELLAECQRDVGVKRRIRVKLSDQFGSPAICGVIEPTILLPSQLVETLTQEHMRCILVHEVAHLQRGDLLVNYAQTLLQIVYWWHPLVWFANLRIRRVREQAVDETVMLRMGDSAAEYPSTLVEVARLASTQPAMALNLVGVMESESALKQRINRLVNEPLPTRAGLGLGGLFVVMISGAGMVPMGQGQITALALPDSSQDGPRSIRKAPSLGEEIIPDLKERPVGSVPLGPAMLPPGSHMTIPQAVLERTSAHAQYANLTKVQISRQDPKTGRSERFTLDVESNLPNWKRDLETELQAGDRVSVSIPLKASLKSEEYVAADQSTTSVAASNSVIQIEARFIEFPSNGFEQFSLGEPLQNSPNYAKAKAPAARLLFKNLVYYESQNAGLRIGSESAVTSEPNLKTWILLPERTHQFFDDTGKIDGLSVLSAPRLITRNNQTAKAKITETKSFKGSAIPAGSALEIMAERVGPDIKIEIHASITELTAPNSDSKQSLFINRITTTVTVANGSTAVLYPEGAKLADGLNWLLLVTPKRVKSE